MNSQKIICPSCKCEISIDDVLTHQIEESIKQKYEQVQKQKDQEIRLKEEELLQRQKKFEEARENLKEIVKQKVSENLQAEKDKLKQELKTQIETEKEQELKLLADQLKEKEQKLDEARKAELELRKQKNELEEAKKEFELDKQRQLDEERVKIFEAAAAKVSQEQDYKFKEMSKQLTDALKVNEELKRKLQQGSQQTQGEVMELELEELLKTQFPSDIIEPVGKGINGADIIQKINDQYGRCCGTIIWESKQTKNWTEGWIPKLKDDQRHQKAEIAVIVSKVLPSDIKTFGYKQGIWITDFNYVAGLALALRHNLLQLNALKLASVGKNEKMEILYNYLTGTEFKQKIEAIVEAFTTMKNELDSEKRIYTKIWSKRQKQIDRVIENTIGMYGELEGLMGKALPKIQTLELDAGEVDQLELEV